MKSVIIYYSLEGNTEFTAKMIVERTGADIIKLRPEKEIPRKGFGKYFYGGKSVIFHEKPGLFNTELNVEDYDTIIIGTPIWAGGFASPINTFLSENIIKNKNIFLFATHRGGGAAKCFAKLTNRLAGNRIKGTADFVDPKNMKIQELDEKVREFCQSISD